jgi:hypothetical protein
MAKSTAFNQKRRNPNRKHNQKVKDRKRSLQLIGAPKSPLYVPNSKIHKPKGALKKLQRRMEHTAREKAIRATGVLTKEHAAAMLDDV